jgi:thioredoxin reductase (NADPH)
LITAIARGGCEAYEVSSEGVREILNRFPDLGDVIMHAFIARRQILSKSGKFTGPRVIGSRYSRDTHRIRDFLTRNRVPFTWLDLESDPQVKKLLEQFGVSELETSHPGVFAAGDVRSGSVKRVASAVGEGAMAVRFVHEYLREM